MRIVSSTDVEVVIEVTRDDLAREGVTVGTLDNDALMGLLDDFIRPLFEQTPLGMKDEVRPIQIKVYTVANEGLLVRITQVASPDFIRFALEEIMASLAGERACPECKGKHVDSTVLDISLKTLDDTIDLCKSVKDKYADGRDSSLYKLNGTYHLLIDVNKDVKSVPNCISEFHDYERVKASRFHYYSEHAETIVADNAIHHLSKI